MSQITTQSPLMQPVEHNGQTYYTSQYFHAQYLAAHSETPKKYQRYDSFMRMLRTLSLYEDYKALGNICELRYAKNTSGELTTNLWLVFKSTGYQPITLLNATAQAELSHHLEDEMSKQLAHAANRHIARDTAQGAHELPAEIAKRTLEAWVGLAEFMNAPRYIALIEGTKAIKQELGIDLSPMLQLSADLDTIPDEQVMLEPTELGKRYGISGADLNRRLERAGVQARVGGEWVATDAGKEHCYRHAWHVGEKSGFNLKWDVGFVGRLLAVGQGA